MAGCGPSSDTTGPESAQIADRPDRVSAEVPTASDLAACSEARQACNDRNPLGKVAAVAGIRDGDAQGQSFASRSGDESRPRRYYSGAFSISTWRSLSSIATKPRRS